MLIPFVPFGVVAELVDALDLGSSAARCESSSLSDPTILKPCSDCKVFLCLLVKLYRHRLSAMADALIGIWVFNSAALFISCC